MKNTGLSFLRIVDSEPLDSTQVRTRAVHAEDIWEHAEHFSDLPQAVQDCSLVVGTTRRRGAKRKSLNLNPLELADSLRGRSGKTALVFGNERSGLENTELRSCTLTSFIPSAAAFPSLNLSHAVQIYAYELFCALGSEPVNSGRSALDQQAIALVVRTISESLALLGFYQQPGREEQEEFLQDMIARAGLSAREGKYLGDIFIKAVSLGLKR
jgi:tRNA/rRNA methyltransferase/tRNA (cytidine32/uridine32-2'-O)-methyltransferase